MSKLTEKVLRAEITEYNQETKDTQHGIRLVHNPHSYTVEIVQRSGGKVMRRFDSLTARDVSMVLRVIKSLMGGGAKE